jgi:hypothetical protein
MWSFSRALTTKETLNLSLIIRPLSIILMLFQKLNQSNHITRVSPKARSHSDLLLRRRYSWHLRTWQSRLSPNKKVSSFISMALPQNPKLYLTRYLALSFLANSLLFLELLVRISHYKLLGSGKTTFLNYLSGRIVGLNSALHMSGKILINGKNREKMPGCESLSCYVQQDDILF